MPVIRGAEPVVDGPDAEVGDFDMMGDACGACVVAQQVKRCTVQALGAGVSTGQDSIGINDEEVVNFDYEEMISWRIFTASNLLLCRAGV